MKKKLKSVTDNMLTPEMSKINSRVRINFTIMFEFVHLNYTCRQYTSQFNKYSSYNNRFIVSLSLYYKEEILYVPTSR